VEKTVFYSSKLTIKSLFEFAAKPFWVFNYLTNKKFELSNVKHKTDKGTNITKSVIEYVNEQYDPGMNCSLTYSITFPAHWTGRRFTRSSPT
jgi:hypothetical protein